MNKSRKILAVLLTVAMLIACLAVFAACDKQDNSEKTVVIHFVGNDSYGYQTDLFSITTTTTKTNLHELMAELKKDKKVAYEYSESTYGAYITGVGFIKDGTTTNLEVGENQYVAILHSINEPDLIDYSNVAKSFKIKGKTFMYSYVGVSSLPLKNGAEYAFYVLSY
mgnify:FL=1